MNRQWERELGNDYIDTQLWFTYDDNGIYFKPEYFDKQSKDVLYFKADIRSSYNGITFGLTSRNQDETFKTFENFFSTGYKIEKEFGDIKIDFSADGYYTEDIDYESEFNITWKISEKFSIYNKGEFFHLQGKEFYKAKVGINWGL